MGKTALYLIFIPGSFVVSNIMLIMGLTNRAVEELLYFTWVPLLVGVIFWAVLLYKSWSAIQDGQVRATPGKAVGFLFIPFFNLYWIFQCVWGFAVDYNAYASRKGITSPKLNENLFLAFCILTLVSLIPYLGGLASLANLVIFFLIIPKLVQISDGAGASAASSVYPQ